MKKFRNLVIALVLVGAMTIPTLAFHSGISANSETTENAVVEKVLGQIVTNDERWAGVKAEDVAILDETRVAPATNLDKAHEAGIDNCVATFQVTVYAKNMNDQKMTANIHDFGNEGTGYVVTKYLDESFVVEPLQEGYTREYYVLRVHENTDGSYSYERLNATYDETYRQVTFTSNQFSDFVFGYTDTKVEPVQPEQPAAQPEVVVKPAPVYDDGGPFTHDECGNVYDRWGNEIWHAPVCAANASNGGYSLVNTADR